MELTQERMPEVVAADPVDGLRPWVVDHRAELLDAVGRDGAVVVRGLDIRTAGRLALFADALRVPLMREREQFAARAVLADGVYSGSEWPAAQPMCMHHEQSYRLSAPSLMLFGQLAEADQGGELTLADGIEVLRRLPEEVVGRFERVGWTVVRNYSADYVGLPWSAAFDTKDREVVEEYCQGNEIAVEWLSGGRLRTAQRRAATVRHQGTGQRCWFNQAAFLNGFSLDPVVREVLTTAYGPDGLPFDTRFGDDEPIPEELVRLINDTGSDVQVTVPWQRGDVVLVDNIRIAHGRTAYVGDRRVATGLAGPVRVGELEPLPVVR